MGVREYVRALEQAMLGLLARYGLAGSRREGYPGVWVGPDKIGSVGVRVSRGITTHGYAFNVDPVREHWAGIIPCGLRGCGVTALAWLLGRPVAVEEVVPAAAACTAEALGYPRCRWVPGRLLRLEQVTQQETHVGRALRQPAHEVGVPLPAEGNVYPYPVSFPG